MMTENEGKDEHRTGFPNELSRPGSQHGSPNDSKNEKKIKRRQAKIKKRKQIPKEDVP